MYLKHWLGRLTEWWNAAFPRGLMRSPLIPGLALAALILGPAIAWHLHRKGQFGKAKRKIDSQLGSGVYNNDRQPGGLDPIVLKRAASAGKPDPEFASVTLLPGLGMTVLQITAYLPAKGETALLSAPSISDIGQGSFDPPNGFNDNHGALELPWGGELMGTSSPVGTSITAKWQGQTFEQSTERSPQVGVAEGGMLQTVAADQQSSVETADGVSAEALFRGVNADDHWPSRSDVRVNAKLSAKALDLHVQVKNTGDQAEPMGIGWHPRFQTVAGSRDQVQLKLPNGEVVAIADRLTGLPSGKIEAPGAVVAHFQAHSEDLGPMSFDESLTRLTAPAGGLPATELRFPAAGFGLRMVAVSPSAKIFRVSSPAGTNYVSMGLQTNLDDPLGHEWGADGSGIVTLQPGDSMEWEIRLEIFALPRP